MRVSTRGRLSAGFFISIALAFTAVSLFTCHWLNLEDMKTQGLFAQCTFDSSAWNTAVFSLMIAALALEVIVVIFVLVSSFLPHCDGHGRHMIKLDLLLCFLIFATQTAALITYGVSSNNAYHGQDGPNFSHSMGWSFWLVIPGAVFGLIAIGPLSHALYAIHSEGGDEDCHF